MEVYPFCTEHLDLYITYYIWTALDNMRTLTLFVIQEMLLARQEFTLAPLIHFTFVGLNTVQQKRTQTHKNYRQIDAEFLIQGTSSTSDLHNQNPPARLIINWTRLHVCASHDTVSAICIRHFKCTRNVPSHVTKYVYKCVTNTTFVRDKNIYIYLFRYSVALNKY
jgi:hypothetical protein